MGQCEHLHFVCVRVHLYVCGYVHQWGWEGYLQCSGKVSVYPCLCVCVCLAYVKCVHVSTCAASRNLPQPWCFVTYAGDFLRSCCDPIITIIFLKSTHPSVQRRILKYLLHYRYMIRNIYSRGHKSFQLTCSLYFNPDSVKQAFLNFFYEELPTSFTVRECQHNVSTPLKADHVHTLLVCALGCLNHQSTIIAGFKFFCFACL